MKELRHDFTNLQKIKSQNSLPAVILYLNHQFDTQGSKHSVIPPSSLGKEWFPPLGLHVELTQCWSRQGSSQLHVLHDWGQREMLNYSIRSYPFSSHQPWKFTSQARLKWFQHRENWWGQFIAAGFITGLDVPQDESGTETQEPNFPFVLCKFYIRKTALFEGIYEWFHRKCHCTCVS